MILLVHLLFGAAIGAAVKNIPLAIILAFLSHYLLDSIPHVDGYPVKITQTRQWYKMLVNILAVTLDFCLGILLILIFSKNQPIIYICALLAVVPDGFYVLNDLIPNKFLKNHDLLHEKIHFLQDKKISKFWRITNQVVVVVISIILLHYS